ncbi:hypothetical protein [Collimonas sp.]
MCVTACPESAIKLARV